MPIYEYECSDCGKRVEQLQKFSDAPLTECPSCHKKKLRRLLSRTSFQLKGEGWYVTDFKDKPKNSNTAGEAQKPKSEEQNSSSPSDSNPESKTESKSESKPPTTSKTTEGKKEPSVSPTK